MIKSLFVCHGNICRSPMAEFVMKDLVKKAGLADRFLIASAATSREEIGNDIHYGTKRILDRHQIAYERRAARQMTAADLDVFDYVIGMDHYNLRNMERICGKSKKLSLLLQEIGSDADVADPWYTGDFDVTYRDVLEGCRALLQRLSSDL